MPTSRRSVLAAASATIASLVCTGAGGATAGEAAEGEAVSVAELVRRSAAGNAALMRGDLEGYLTEVTYSDDFTLMSPFGGAPTHGPDFTRDRMESIARFFRNGDFAQELVESYATPDMVVLVLIERQHVEVGGLPAQDWALRVTLVYRRDDGEWRLAHRHADPLVRGVSLEAAAALAR